MYCTANFDTITGNDHCTRTGTLRGVAGERIVCIASRGRRRYPVVEVAFILIRFSTSTEDLGYMYDLYL